MNKIELLAPAKDLECGIAAINCGADAVYIGAAKFGAREDAANPLEDIAKLIDHAHKYYAKVYAAVNTLLYDHEIQPALELINNLYSIGIDAIIIQDTGLLECDLPPIPIIASTQMHNNTPEKISFLEKVGIKRAILARELTLEEIKKIKAKSSKIELECFIHGSLCVCYSGQCYLSYGLGGRSSNRGACAQPCRKEYSLIDSENNILVKNKNLLSVKDLNLSDHIKDLIEAGVTSFKIEGRLKDKAYVSNVVGYYRQKLDEILPQLGLLKASTGKTELDFEPDVSKTFNRGFSTYFLNGRDQKIGSTETPKMMGELVGRVESIGKRAFALDNPFELHPGDGICFFNKSGALGGTNINGVNGRIITPDKLNGIVEGIEIFRNHDHKFILKLSKSNPARLIEAKLKLSETSSGFNISAKDEDGNLAQFSMDSDKTPADKPMQAEENIKRQLSKSGGTEFSVGEVKLELSQVWFIPMSTLNELRRNVIEKLRQIRIEKRPIEKGKVLVNDFPYPLMNLTFEGNVLNQKSADFYRRHCVIDIDRAAESGLDLIGKKVMTTRYCIKHQLNSCHRYQSKTDDFRYIKDPVYLIDPSGCKLELEFDCAECKMEVHMLKRIA